MKKRALFLCIHRPNRSPSQRFRFEQYLKYLEENGWECKHSYLIDEKSDKFFYKSGHVLKKVGVILNATFKRFKEVDNSRAYDLVYVQREAYMLGTTFFERKFSKSSKVVFDFDDAVWMHQKGENRSGNKRFSFLKRPSKTAELIEMSDMTFAGNPYLAEYASQYNRNVKIVPTTIDTDEYSPLETTRINSKTVCIGWSGSLTTIPHFKYALPALKLLKDKYGDRISIKVIGDVSYSNEELGIQGIPWRKDTELDDLREIDIGLMPLPNEEWTKGKCGLKGLQYMALGIPTIMSPVGVNSDIVQHAENGFLADQVDDWVECISNLIENPELRYEVGMAGRKTVVEKYSVTANRDLYLDYFNSLV